MATGRVAAIMGALFLTGAALKYVFVVPAPEVVAGRLAEGVETQVILLASPSCGTCQSAEFVDLMRSLLTTLEHREWGDTAHLSKVFVGLGSVVEEQLALAHRYGRFDELVLGHGWSNMGAMRYIWQDMPSEGATPNLVVTRRTLAYNEHTRGIAPTDEVVLARLIGIDEIRRWASNGSPLP